VSTRPRRASTRGARARESRTAVPRTAAPNPGRARTGAPRIRPRTAAGRIATLPAVLANGTGRAETVAIALIEITRGNDAT